MNFKEKEKGEYELSLTNGEEKLSAVLKEKNSLFKKAEYDIMECEGLAFDHAKIIATAYTVLQKNVESFEFLLDFMPEKFTLTGVQKVQEAILGNTVLPANFRRKIADYVVETEEYVTGAGHRPAKLFKRKEQIKKQK